MNDPGRIERSLAHAATLCTSNAFVYTPCTGLVVGDAIWIKKRIIKAILV